MRYAIDFAYGVRNWVLPHWGKHDRGGEFKSIQCGDFEVPEDVIYPEAKSQKDPINLDPLLEAKKKHYVAPKNKCVRATKKNAKPITFWTIATPLIVLAVRYFGKDVGHEITNLSTYSPTFEPTFNPINDSTWSPTNSPTSHPSWSPSLYPTWSPTFSPTGSPTDKNITCPYLGVFTNAGEMYYIAEGSAHELYFNFTNPNDDQVDLELNWLDTGSVKITPPLECESTQTSSKCNNVTGAVRFGIFGVRQGSNMIDDKISCNDDLYEEQQTTYVVQ